MDLPCQFLVCSISPEAFDRFSLNFTQMLLSVEQFAEPLTQLCSLKVQVTLQGHGFNPSICVRTTHMYLNPLKDFHYTLVKCQRDGVHNPLSRNAASSSMSKLKALVFSFQFFVCSIYSWIEPCRVVSANGLTSLPKIPPLRLTSLFCGRGFSCPSHCCLVLTISECRVKSVG